MSTDPEYRNQGAVSPCMYLIISALPAGLQLLYAAPGQLQPVPPAEAHRRVQVQVRQRGSQRLHIPLHEGRPPEEAQGGGHEHLPQVVITGLPAYIDSVGMAKKCHCK